MDDLQAEQWILGRLREKTHLPQRFIRILSQRIAGVILDSIIREGSGHLPYLGEFTVKTRKVRSGDFVPYLQFTPAERALWAMRERFQKTLLPAIKRQARGLPAQYLTKPPWDGRSPFKE